MTSPSAWWATASRWKRTMAILGVFFATFSAGITLLGQIKAGEPYWPAHRGFVTETVEHSESRLTRSLLPRLLDTQIAVERGAKDRLEFEVERQTQLLEQQQQNLDPAIRRVLIEQINSLRDKLNESRGRLDTLTRERSGRRP